MGENIFKHIFSKGLLLKTYKELIKLNSNKQNTQLKNEQRAWIDISLKKELILRNCHTVFHSSYPKIQSHWQCLVIIFWWIFIICCLFENGQLIGSEWFLFENGQLTTNRLIVVFIWISLMINDTEYLFIPQWPSACLLQKNILFWFYWFIFIIEILIHLFSSWNKHCFLSCSW